MNAVERGQCCVLDCLILDSWSYFFPISNTLQSRRPDSSRGPPRDRGHQTTASMANFWCYRVQGYRHEVQTRAPWCTSWYLSGHQRRRENWNYRVSFLPFFVVFPCSRCTFFKAEQELENRPWLCTYGVTMKASIADIYVFQSIVPHNRAFVWIHFYRWVSFNQSFRATLPWRIM